MKFPHSITENGVFRKTGQAWTISAVFDVFEGKHEGKHGRGKGKHGVATYE
jgi:hypothetical protein